MSELSIRVGGKPLILDGLTAQAIRRQETTRSYTFAFGLETWLQPWNIPGCERAYRNKSAGMRRPARGQGHPHCR